MSIAITQELREQIGYCENADCFDCKAAPVDQGCAIASGPVSVALLKALEATEKQRDHLAAILAGCDICPTEEHNRACEFGDIDILGSDEERATKEKACIECLCRFAAEKTSGGEE